MNRLMLWMAACCAVAFSAAGTAQSATDVTCTSCVGETDLANQAVTSVKIANGTIAAADIKLNTITSDRIRNQTIVKADLAPSLQDALGSALTNLTVQRVSASGGGVVGASCPSGRIPVAASCECDNAGGTRNLGVLFGCTVGGTGAAAGCFEEARSFNPTLPAPLAIVRAVCLGARTVDGTPWVPTSTGLAVDSGDASDSQAADHAEWMKAQHEAFEAVLAKFKGQRDAYERATRPVAR